MLREVLTMPDLISRKALLYEYDRVHVGEPGGARKLIEDAPAVDAEPVRHVKWKYQTFRIDRRVTVDGEVTCADCHAKHFRVVGTWFKHCPYCGAILDGGAE